MPQRGGLISSAALHLGMMLIALFGLPSLFKPPVPEEMPVAVQLVNIAPETRATRLSQIPPRPEAKPDEVAQAEPPKPEPKKPESTPPAPAPPPSPAPKPPETKPEPPKPEPPKPEPPPPPPAAKPPEPKPPPPPPPPPKPPSPRQEAKATPKKEDDAAFDALLRNLSRRDTAQTNQPPQQKPAPAQPRRASSQPIAPLGAQLSTSEIDLVRQQLYNCWNVPAGARDAQDLQPEFRVYMNPDGTVRSATLLNSERQGDPFFRAAAESALRALHNPHCSPLKLPPDKYDLWRTFTITFDPRDIT